MKEENDLGGHESHGGREDLGPAASPELSHDANDKLIALYDAIAHTAGVTREIAVAETGYFVHALVVAMTKNAQPDMAGTEPRSRTMMGFRAALQCIYDTFSADLAQGYRTRDKEFAVEIAGAALRIGSGTQPTHAERAPATRRSEAP